MSNLVGVCPVLAFTASGTHVVTSAATKYKKGDACGDIRNGKGVSVTGTVLPDKSVLATDVEVK